ncbi:MAG: DUF3427 domain-containing protein [Candidatus Sabulitectum sp.]|nr:DUF3427 domain-containing protein [Candidatus Sabulitectum sp.]
MSKQFPYIKDHLTAGGKKDPFLPKLLQTINHATEIDIAVGFVMSPGIRLLFDALLDALEAGTKVRILTGDYLCVTDPEALRTLLVLQENGAESRIFESKGHSFHMKAYLFVRTENDVLIDGRAFIGSSNISKSALTHGFEWNLRVDWKENPKRFEELRYQFDQIFNHSKTKEITNAWIEAYAARRPQGRVAFQTQPGADEKSVTPEANHIQVIALKLLAETRAAGNERGLVVMATGTGKTWLAAFDSKAVNAKRILFVAHREEILKQAEDTFIRIRPTASVGKYTAKSKDIDADLLFASIQTIGKMNHLRKFPEDYFDYIVVDEFHHAAARTYQKLLAHFSPRFLLGLTATPDRTDQADILSLCDNNLVIQNDLFDSIRMHLLCPFHYNGIADSSVDYQEIPWRNGKFDPEKLDNKLATVARANHILRVWKEKKQAKTLAFCVSTKHSDFMAEFFSQNGISASSVHSKSSVRRNEALQMLRDGRIEVLFSVDLFNEGVDLPEIDTVLMIRPTESKILFLQQLGRGLRTNVGKNHLVVLDFIGNHLSFFKKFEAMFKLEKTNQARRKFLKMIEEKKVMLPPGCFLNYDLETIEFLRGLLKTRTDMQTDFYQSLKTSFGRRPTLSEFYIAGGGIPAIRREHGQWFKFLESQKDIGTGEIDSLNSYGDFLAEVESTSMVKSFKMILLEALLDLDGFSTAPTITDLARRSFKVMTRRKKCQGDLPEKFKVPFEDYSAIEKRWITYWKGNPINAWVGGNATANRAQFEVIDDRFVFKADIVSVVDSPVEQMVMELVNYRYEQYNARKAQADRPHFIETSESDLVQIPFFTDLGIACGHFKSSTHEMEVAEYKTLPDSYGNLNPARHFIARARGNSMNGGKTPIKDGAYLLLDLITPDAGGSISNQLVVIERQDAGGDDQYLLRYVKKNGSGDYTLKAWNEEYPDISANEGMTTIARVKSVIDPLDLVLQTAVMRADIPPLFDLVFSQGFWQSGHVCPKGHENQFLLVTLNKQGQKADHRYHDYFIDDHTFHWQSQRSTKPSMKRGLGVIEHRRMGSKIHLFVRKNKLVSGKGAPFYYCGLVNYISHTGSEPMSVKFAMETPLSESMVNSFGIQKS